MDNRNEDKIVRQIEKNLSNNINENLFLSGRSPENRRTTEYSRLLAGNNALLVSPEDSSGHNNAEAENQDIPLVSSGYINNTPGISRAEYIRQAREACLRQLSNAQLYSRPYDVNYMDQENNAAELPDNQKDNAIKLLQNDSKNELLPEEHSQQELASYRSLVIRCVCAIILFLSIFAFDKFNLKAGTITNKTFQEYVTGNDALQDLENILVTWLK